MKLSSRRVAEADSKTRILAAAEVEFLARGYDRARMQVIADRAQVNKAMLHYHFRNKDELFLQIFKNKAGALFPRLEEGLRRNEDFLAITCEFIDQYVAYLIENPFLPSYLVQVATNHVALLEQVSIEFPKRFVRAFDAAVRKQAIAPHDAKQFVVSLLGMCVMPFMARNLVKQVIGLDDRGYEKFLKARAAELKRYVVLMLTPVGKPSKRSQRASN